MPEQFDAGGCIVECRGISKRFKMYRNPWHRAAEWATLNRASLHRDFWAVRDVSFELQRGECLGIVGRNGSGKSTLLKLVTGVSVATEGHAEIHGRVLSLIELGAGLNKELTGRQNVFNMARLLNFPPGFAKDRIDAIEAFAEIGDFFDRPTKTYSSGMTVRLTFSIFQSFEPEVLVVDEALSVGDVFFVQKCSRRIQEMLDAGTTMLFVSHSPGAVTNLCSRAILLERGRVTFDGEPEDTIARYHDSLRRGDQPAKPAAPTRAAAARQDASNPPAETDHAAATREHSVLHGTQHRRHGEGGIRIEACRLTNADDQDRTVFGVGDTLRLRMLLRADRAVPAPRAGLRIFDRYGVQVFGQGTMQQGTDVPPLEAGDELLLTFDLTLDVSPGDYTLGVSTSEPSGDGDPQGAIFHDHINGLGPIRVKHPPMTPLPFLGLARLPMSVSCERLHANPGVASHAGASA